MDLAADESSGKAVATDSELDKMDVTADEFHGPQTIEQSA